MDLVDALVAKAMSGGGSGTADPALTNAKLTGGIGWTTTETASSLTWDGSTEGRETYYNEYYKISSLINTTASSFIGKAYRLSDGTSGTLTSEYISEDSAAYGIPVTISFTDDTPIAFVAVSGNMMDISEGTYFATGDSYIVYLEGDFSGTTVHMISDTYIPEESDVLWDAASAVEITFDGDLTGKETVVSGNYTYVKLRSTSIPYSQCRCTVEKHARDGTVVSGTTRGTSLKLIGTSSNINDWYLSEGQAYIIDSDTYTPQRGLSLTTGVWVRYRAASSTESAEYFSKISSVATEKISKGEFYSYETTAIIGYCGEVFNVDSNSPSAATGRSSHVEGMGCYASGISSHAEGSSTSASGEYGAHSEGRSTTASGDTSHSEGRSTTASGDASHSEGLETVASGLYSHTEGTCTIASNTNSHAQGAYNNTALLSDISSLPAYDSSTTYTAGAIVQSDNNAYVCVKACSQRSPSAYWEYWRPYAYQFMIGDGYRAESDSTDYRSNSFAVDYLGNIYPKGIIIPSSTSGSTKKFKITVDDSGTITATEVT